MNPLPLHPAVRVHPFTGLVIDVDTWATAHDYHRQHQQLHLLTLHGSGVAYGLDILPTDPPSDTVVVEPGVAVDSLGNVIVLPERQQLALTNGGGTAFIVLDYVESIPRGASDQKDTRARVREDFRLRVLQGLPEAPAIELARVEVTAGARTIVAPVNPWSPGANEIDSRFQPRLVARAPREISVGLVVHGAEDSLSPSHLQGFQLLMRELGFCGFRPSVITASANSIPDAELLYVTASAQTPLPAALVKRLSEHLSQGSWLFADPCGAGTEMVQSLDALVKGRSGGAERTENFVLTSRFVFGAAPPGAFPTREIIWGENTLVSPRDYGCAWAGHRGDQVYQRDQVRSALEFGVNVAYGVSRHFTAG